MNIKRLYSLLSMIAVLVVVLFLSAFTKPIAPLFVAECKNFADTIPATDTGSEGKIFEKVDEEAYFPGGEESWRSYLEQNLNPSVPVDKGAPAGLYTVYIQFIVGKDGRIYDIKALTKHGYGMEGEVMRILRKSPPWVAAVQNGRPVNAYRKQPVTFQVIEEKKKKRGRG